MNLGVWGYAALTALAGLLIPVMMRLNASLGAALGSVTWAALVLLSVGAGCVALAIAVAGVPVPQGWSGPPRAVYLAGTIVAFYVVALTWAIPRFGVGPSILCVVTAQIVAAVTIDHFGLLGSAVREVDWRRALGAVLMIVGVALAARPAAT